MDHLSIHIVVRNRACRARERMRSVTVDVARDASLLAVPTFTVRDVLVRSHTTDWKGPVDNLVDFN